MKVLLTVLLGILILILFSVLLILFVPFRYRGSVWYDESVDIHAKVSFCLQLVTLQVIFKDKKTEISGKYLWFIPYHLNSEKSKKAENSKKKKKSRKKAAEKSKFSLEMLKEKTKSLKNAWDHIQHSEKAVKRLFKIVKKLLLHILPKEIKGDLTIGMEDPAETGKILGYISMIYPLLWKQVTVTPDFQKKVLIAHLNFKGYIRLSTIIRISLPVLINRELRNFIGGFKNVKSSGIN